MTSGPSLPIPEPPGPVAPLQGPSDALIHAAPAARRPVLLTSSRTRASGTEMEGVHRVSGDGQPLLAELRTGAGPCSTVLVGPREMRRELSGPGGTVLETLLVADRHPGMVAQWHTPGGGALALDVEWEVPGPVVAQRSSGAVLRVRPEKGNDRIFAFHPAPDTWDIRRDPGRLRIRVRVRGDEGRVSLLAGTAAPEDDGGALLTVLSGARALEARADAFARAVREERLATRTGVPGLDDVLAWAVARTSSAAGAGIHPGGGLDTLWLVAGALASGDHAAARALVAGPPADPAGVLALAWWVRWTGDTDLPGRHREAALAALKAGEEVATTPTADLVLPAARDGLAEALEALGDRTAARLLREAPPAPAPSRARQSAAPRGGVSLPMARGPGTAEDDRGAIGRAVLGAGGPSSPIEPERPGEEGVARALRAWALFATGRPDAAYPLLRRHMADGMTNGAGIWSGERDAGRSPDSGSDAAAALVPAVFLHGLLGARPEAPWGRLRLAPALPERWSSLEVTGIRVADARIALSFARNGGAHTFTLRQESGRVPVNVVFEPAVAGTVEEVRVDDEGADLVPERERARTRVRLQLPLDTARRVTLLIGGA